MIGLTTLHKTTRNYETLKIALRLYNESLTVVELSRQKTLGGALASALMGVHM